VLDDVVVLGQQHAATGMAPAQLLGHAVGHAVGAEVVRTPIHPIGQPIDHQHGGHGAARMAGLQAQAPVALAVLERGRLPAEQGEQPAVQRRGGGIALRGQALPAVGQRAADGRCTQQGRAGIRLGAAAADDAAGQAADDAAGVEQDQHHGQPLSLSITPMRTATRTRLARSCTPSLAISRLR
jgi:hypothetical protein